MAFSVSITITTSDFITSLTPKMQAKVLRTIGLLEEFGYQLTEPHSKKIVGHKNLFELRIKLGSDICRLFYFHHKGNFYFITSGYVKNENKTKPSEIKKAEILMNTILGELK